MIISHQIETKHFRLRRTYGSPLLFVVAISLQYRIKHEPSRDRKP